MLNWLRIFFSILVLYNVLYDGIVSIRNKDYSENETSTAPKGKSTVADFIVRTVVCLTCFGFLLFIIWSKMIPEIIGVILISVPTVLRHLSNSIKASKSLKEIIFEADSDKEFTIKEKIQFDIFVGGLLMFNVNCPFEIILNAIKESEFNPFYIQSICSFYTLLISFIVVFILVVELITPLRQLQKGCDFVAARIGKQTKKWFLYFWKKWDSPLFVARFTNKMLLKYGRSKVFLKILVILSLPFSLAIDLIMNAFLFIYYFVICSCLGALIEFLRLIGIALLRIMRSISNIPGHKVMKNTFRISMIVALIFVVIVNRFNFFYNCDATFVEISEFIASAILIPVVFEWIYSGTETKKTNGV